MIELTGLNGKLLFINPMQMECIQVIPETKIVMMNGKYHIVKESPHEIADIVKEFYQGLGSLVTCAGAASLVRAEEGETEE